MYILEITFLLGVYASIAVTLHFMGIPISGYEYNTIYSVLL